MEVVVRDVMAAASEDREGEDVVEGLVDGDSPRSLTFKEEADLIQANRAYCLNSPTGTLSPSYK